MNQVYSFHATYVNPNESQVFDADFGEYIKRNYRRYSKGQKNKLFLIIIVLINVISDEKRNKICHTKEHIKWIELFCQMREFLSCLN